jgi:hypothetical protein
MRVRRESENKAEACYIRGRMSLPAIPGNPRLEAGNLSGNPLSLVCDGLLNRGASTMRDDDFTDDVEGILEETDETEELINVGPGKASNAWRSIERYREIKELRKHLDDLFEEGDLNDLKDLRW